VTRPKLLVEIAAGGSLYRRIESVLAADGIAVADNGEQPAVRVVGANLATPASVARLQEALGGDSQAPVVAISPDCGPFGMRRAVRAGAASVVLEHELENALAPAVRAVAAGLTAVPASLRYGADRLAFSHREREVLRLAIDGHTNGEIASALFLAESTVKSHLSSAYRKLGAGSRKAAAAMILDPGEGLAEMVLGESAAEGERDPVRPAP
jgi:DNA-binding NarL/FixJ family response regulator